MFWPGLRPNQTRIIRDALEQMQALPEDEAERAKLAEWFDAEVQANAEARRNQTGAQE